MQTKTVTLITGRYRIIADTTLNLACPSTPVQLTATVHTWILSNVEQNTAMSALVQKTYVKNIERQIINCLMHWDSFSAANNECECIIGLSVNITAVGYKYNGDQVVYSDGN